MQSSRSSSSSGPRPLIVIVDQIRDCTTPGMIHTPEAISIPVSNF